jgi:hypothetical protein
MFIPQSRRWDGKKVATMVHYVSITPWSACDCVLWGEMLDVDEEVHTNEQQKNN